MNYEEIFQKVRDNKGKISGNKLKFLDEETKKIIYGFTSFLNDSASLRERLYCMEHNIVEYKICLSCNSKRVTNFINSRYSDYCSLACSNSASQTKKKRQETNIKKYGTPNPFGNEEVKKKIKETNIEKYGVDNPSKSEEIQQKKLRTNIDKYGVDHYSKYHISPESLYILQDKDLLLDFCIKNFEAYRLLGIDKTTLHRYLSAYGIKDKIVKSHKSEMEINLCNFLSSHGISVISGNRSIIPPFELDLLLPDLNIAIECNGLFWHSELNGKDRNYHKNKSELCKKAGIQLIHIFDYEYRSFRDIIYSRLLSKTNKSERYYARNADVIELSVIDEIKFFNNTHIQQYTRSSVCYGLISNDNIIAAASFIKSRYSKVAEWELLRFSSIGTCVGGMSKLFKYFIKMHSPKSVITYSDKNWNTGSSYSRLGFKFSHTSPPNYFYTADYRHIESRLRYQKHKLEKLLPIFDKNKTEWENMKDNGYDRIWNCGNDVWIWGNNE